MNLRQIRGDLKRSRAVSLTLGLLITLATALVALSISLISQTVSAMGELWDQAVPPSLVQMTLGDVDEAQVLDWAATQSEITATEVIKTLPISGSELWIGGISQAESVMEPACITQPKNFDFLISADGTPAQPAAGEVALPVIYQASGIAEVGDVVQVKIGDLTLNLTVSEFVRDAQMNTSLATSKRLVLNEQDFAAVEAQIEAPEYLIEFLLADESKSTQVKDAYIAAGLPAQGIAVDSTIFKLVNSLTTVLVAVAALLVAALLAFTSALALRFALLASIESDLAEIGTLKAIGSPPSAIKRIYIAKYVLLAGLGAVLGWAISLWLSATVSPGLLIYLGTPSPSLWQFLLPALGAGLVFLSIIAFAWFVLRRIDKLSATEALRFGRLGQLKPRKIRTSLARSKWLPVPAWLGLRGALRWANWLVIGVLGLSTFLMVLPAGVAATQESPNFMTYLGVGQADVRIDVRDGAADFTKVQTAVADSAATAKSVTLISNRYEVEGPDGWESLVVERGDHTAFPLTYEDGTAPTAENQLALSHNEAAALGVTVGSQVNLKVGNQTKNLTVCGIYQDITNGGKTGKAAFTDESAPLWQVILIQLNDGHTAESFSESFAVQFPGIKVTPMTEMTAQVMGTTSSQLGLLATISLWAGAGLAFLMVALAAVLAISRERSQIAAQRALGTSNGGLWTQYLIRFGVLGLLGVAAGLVGFLTLGQLIFGAGVGILGAPGAALSYDPLFTLALVPLLLVAVVLGAASLALKPLSTISIQDQE